MPKNKNAEINLTIAEIFEDLDKAISKCQFSTPRAWNESQFKKYYDKLKIKWLSKIY